MTNVKITKLAITIAAAAAISLGWSTGSLATASTAQAAPTPSCSPGVPIAGDYNGDGSADLAVGVERQSTDYDAPFSVIPTGSSSPYLVGEGTTQGDLVNADLNGDICADAVIAGTTLALGSPDGLNIAGATSLTLPQASLPTPEEELQVTATALRHDQISQVAVAGWTYDVDDGCCERHQFLDVFTLDANGAPGTPQVFDLTARDARGTLAIASSGRTIAVGDGDLAVAGKVWAGGVYMFSSTAAHPTTMTYRTTLTQNSKGVPGSAETEDGFGSAVSFRDGRLAIGAPGESIGKAVYAGQVQPILWHEAKSTWTAFRAINQGTRGVVGTNESGDQFGYNVLVTRGLTATGSYDIAISATEKVGTSSAGSVTVANFRKAIYRTLTENTKGVPGTAQTADDFGAGLGVLRTSSARDTLLIGIPGKKETLPSQPVGNALRSDGKKLSSRTRWSMIPRLQDSGGAVYTAWGRAFAR